MSHACCLHCRLRFTGHAASYLTACPDCERPMAKVDELGRLLGFQLFDPQEIADLVSDDTPPVPRPEGGRG